MKRIYFIRAAKAKGFYGAQSDYERTIKPKGLKEIKTIGSYLALHNISIDVILSSYAQRAQDTVVELDKIVSFSAKKQFLEALYYQPCDEMIKIIKALDDEDKNLLIVGHYPQLNELINELSSESINSIPNMGVVALEFDVEHWADLDRSGSNLDFFIYPKQFKYYMPDQIRTRLAL